ncbi:MAG TPA: protein kinase [Anaerolineales bacterium]
MSTWAGRTLGKVRIDSLLARGGMAEVYLGTHTTLQRDVVVKILRGHYEDDPTLLERFQREARVVAKLRHPNIVQVFDFDTVDDQPYIVMEYIPGPSLSRYLKALHERIGRLELPVVDRILTGVASALQYAHESGMIHRDVKPGNILLNSRSSRIIPGEPLPADFEPILTDFGLVRMLSVSEQTTVGRIAGTPAYMSPEQARGEQTDERTDIYSLGIVLYQLLAGHVPFDGESTVSILLKHINEPPPPIPGLSVPLQSILERALAKNPADRFQTPKELATAFNAVMEERSEASTLARPVPTVVATPARERADRPLLQKRLIQTGLAAIAVIAIVSISVLNGFPAFANSTPAASPTLSPTLETPVSVVSSPLGPTGVLRFQDGTAIMDRATLKTLAMPAPPAGSQYEVWLVGGEERLSLGILLLDENGQGTLTYDHSQGENLLALYDQVEIRIKPITDSDPDVFERVAYSYTLPASGLEYVRRLLVSSPMAPERAALIQGLSADAELINQNATEMLSAYEDGDEAGAREYAEGIMNILVGSQSQAHKDWNEDGQITDPGDGYGFSLNGNHLGHIQAVYSHADYAANSPGASQNMIVNGERVKACAQNLAQWVPQLRDHISRVLTAASAAEMNQPLRDSVTLADQILNGIDEDDDGQVEPASGECGVLTAYSYAYQMANMPLLPVNPVDTPTAVGTVSPSPTFSIFNIRPTNTSERSPNPSVNTPLPPANNPPTDPPNDPPTDPPDNPRVPTKKPKESNTPKPLDQQNEAQPTKKK